MFDDFFENEKKKVSNQQGTFGVIGQEIYLTPDGRIVDGDVIQLVCPVVHQVLIYLINLIKQQVHVEKQEHQEKQVLVEHRVIGGRDRKNNV